MTDAEPGHLAVGHGRVGAHVLDVVGAGGQQHAVLVGRRGDLQRLLAGVPAADQVLRPVLDPLHRPVTEDHRGHHDGLVLAGGKRLLAERSAHIAHHDPDLVLGDAQQAGIEQPLIVHALAGDDHLEPPGPLIPLSDDTAGLHGHAHVPVLRERLVEDVRRAVQQPVQLGLVLGREHPGHVVRQLRVHQRAARGQRRGRVHDRLIRFDVDADQLGGVLGQVPRLGHHDDDRLADEPDVAVGQHPPRGAVHRSPGDLAGPSVDVGRGQHRDHARRPPRLADVQAGDPAPGHRGAHERGVHQARLLQVVDVPPVPGDHPLILQARHPLPDPPRGGCSGKQRRRVRVRAHGWPPYPAAGVHRAVDPQPAPGSPGAGVQLTPVPARACSMSSMMRSGDMRLVVERDPERVQRIADRVQQRGRGGDGAALAQALVPARAQRRGDHVTVLQVRDLGRGGQQVVHERGRGRVARVVVAEVLIQHPADSLHHAAGDLPLHHVRVDHLAAVLGDHVPQDLHHARLPVDLDRHRVAGVGAHPGRCVIPLGDLQAQLGARRQRRRVEQVGGRGDLGQRHALALRVALHVGGAVGHLQVARVDLQHLPGHGQHPLLHGRAGQVRRPADHPGGQAAAGEEAVRGGVRVALDEVHVLDVHAHLVGHDLGHGRLDALPVAAGAHVHVDLAAGLDPDRGRGRAARAARRAAARCTGTARGRPGGLRRGPPPGPCGTARSRSARPPAPGTPAG